MTDGAHTHHGPGGIGIGTALLIGAGLALGTTVSRAVAALTGEVDQVLIPCGATLASICPPCAERAKELRAAQCREGWHLDAEPIPTAPPPDDVQAMSVEHRAGPRPTATAPGQPGRTRPGWMS